MKSLLCRRPSPALLISLIALFVSLSGVSYGVATGFIDSREIKNNTVRSKDLRNNDIRTRDLRNNEVRGLDIRSSTVQGRDVALNTLTGADVRESSLAKVPSAAAADTATSATSATTAGSATNAQSAATVGGLAVRKLFVKQPTGTALTEVLRGDGFVLNAGCSGGTAQLEVDGLAGAPETNVTIQGVNGVTAFSETNSNLGPASSVNMLGGGGSAGGTAVISTTAGVVSMITYAAQNAPAFQGENVCAVRGTVVVG